jgi:hypothetical protein
MAFTFPTDSNNKAGAVKPTTSGTDFYIPSREMGSESISTGIQTVATAGTAAQLPNTPCRRVIIIALRANTGYIYVGGSGVTSVSYGVELAARDSIELNISNANLLYINSSVSGEGVSYIVI